MNMVYVQNELKNMLCGGEFNNRRKLRKRYIQHEKALGFEYGKRSIKEYEDSPARCQREVRALRKIKGFEKVTRVWV